MSKGGIMVEAKKGEYYTLNFFEVKREIIVVGIHEGMVGYCFTQSPSEWGEEPVDSFESWAEPVA